MPTRNEIEIEYDIQDGVIVSRGKFEGEPIYAPYFADLYGSGEQCGEDWPENAEAYEVEPEDVDQFPELANIRRVITWEDDLGFFHMDLEYDA